MLSIMKYIIKVLLALLTTAIIFYSWLAVGLIFFSGSYSNITADIETVIFIGVWVFVLYAIITFKKKK